MNAKQSYHYHKVDRLKGFRFNRREISTIRRFLHQRILEYRGAIAEMIKFVKLDDTGWARRNLEFYEHSLAAAKLMLRRAAQEQRWIRDERPTE